MSHKVGAHLGGVRTVECLRLRSVVCEDTGCWRWGLAKSEVRGDGEGRPKVSMPHPKTGRLVVVSGRRAALMLDRGADLPEGHWAFAKRCCAFDDCVNPAHSRSGSRKEHGEYLQRSGRNKGLPTLVKAARRVAKARRRLTDAQVLEIRRNHGVQNGVFAEKFGVSLFTIWAVRKGHRYADVGRIASVFDLGGMAA